MIYRRRPAGWTLTSRLRVSRRHVSSLQRNVVPLSLTPSLNINPFTGTNWYAIHRKSATYVLVSAACVKASGAEFVSNIVEFALSY